MGSPVTVAALRRYTTTAQRSIAYSVFYAIMNGGFFIALYISDALRAGMGEHGRFAVPGLGMELSTYRTIFLVSLALAVPSLSGLLLVARGRRGDRPGRGHHSRAAQVPRLEYVSSAGMHRPRHPARDLAGSSSGCGSSPAFTSSLPSSPSRPSSR
jgi:hypothetical protein